MTEPRDTGDASHETDDLQRLQDLILGEEKARLQRLDWRVSDLESRTTDVAEVLSGAMNRLVDDPVSQPDIERPIVESIRGAVKRDTESFAEALFPVLGPAIRRAVADALRSLADRINLALEHSFTIKGLRWRMEAARSGLPFGQVVLRNTMVYAVQEVFLIQRHSGLVLASVRRDEALKLDEDAFSAMLTAIQAFVQDSLGTMPEERLRSVELDDRTLWVISGPKAALACVITGTPPLEVRDRLMDTLESLHARLGLQLGQPPEELAGNQGMHVLMEETLREEAVEAARGRAKGSFKAVWAGAGVLLLLALWLGWNMYRDHQLEQHLMQVFAAEPGYVLTGRDENGGKLSLAGLRDPLAVEPESLLQSVDLDTEDVTLAFRPYQSLEAAFVMRRLRASLGADADLALELDESGLIVHGELTSHQYALLEGLPGSHPVISSVDLSGARLAGPEAARLLRQQLAAPESVSIVPTGDQLVLSGNATANWFASAKASAQAIGGWTIDFSPLRAVLVAELDAVQQRVNGSTIRFARQLDIASADLRALDELAAQLAELQELASVLETDVSIRLEGFADGSGVPKDNRELALNRARTVQSALSSRGVDAARITLVTGPWVEGVADPALRKVVVLANEEEPQVINRKICLLGAFAVGKTSLVRRFVQGVFDERYLSTLGVKIDTKTVDLHPEPVKLILWDMEGADQSENEGLIMSSRVKAYLQGTDGVLLVADGTRPATVDAARHIYEWLAGEYPGVPVALLLNKSDLVETWQVDPNCLDGFGELLQCFTTSALSGENVESTFRALAKALTKA